MLKGVKSTLYDFNDVKKIIETIKDTAKEQNIVQTGGLNYIQKYLKYKQKYLQIKKLLIKLYNLITYDYGN